jgi:hypothetical protein
MWSLKVFKKVKSNVTNAYDVSKTITIKKNETAKFISITYTRCARLAKKKNGVQRNAGAVHLYHVSKAMVNNRPTHTLIY